MYERLVNGIWTPVTGDFKMEGVVYPHSALDAWSAQDRANFGFRLKPVDLVDYARSARWNREIGGINVGGVPVATDDRSKTLLLGARLRAQSDPNLIEKFDAADGSSATLNAAAIIAISDAVGEHVSRCFSTFDAVKADIASGAITTTAQIDAQFAAI